MVPKAGKDRLIAALDVSTHEEALELVEKLDNVSFFKIGLQLLFAGDVLGCIRRIQNSRATQGGVFVDLKLAGDIGNTITGLVQNCPALNVKFLTLVETTPTAITIRTIEAIKKARGGNQYPLLLMVPLLSSLDTGDLHSAGSQDDATQYIVERGKVLLRHGCDGLIVSGEAIRKCRAEFPEAYIVSPGIRPHGAASDDHKRIATPRQAIRFGADYLIVGRPISKAANPRDAAQKIIDEIDQAQGAGPKTITQEARLDGRATQQPAAMAS